MARFTPALEAVVALSSGRRCFPIRRWHRDRCIGGHHIRNSWGIGVAVAGAKRKYSYRSADGSEQNNSRRESIVGIAYRAANAAI